MSSVLVTIPARAGSKGVKNKNLKLLNGVPLFAFYWASDIPDIHDVVLTTDFEPEALKQVKYHDFGRHERENLYIHPRPSGLCTDVALAWDVWQDAVQAAQIHFKKTWDIHLYLEPTSPCRTQKDIQKCIDLVKSGKDSVCTVSKAQNPEKFIQIKNGSTFCMDFDGFLNNKPRQQYPNNWYMKNGICYACSDERMKSATTMLDPATHFLLINRPVVNIDSEEDFIFAEALMNQAT